MNRETLLKLLTLVRSGEIEPSEALLKLQTQPFEELAHATLDLHRALRQGVPEVVLGSSKSAEQIYDCLNSLHEHHNRALATRVAPAKARRVQSLWAESHSEALNYDRNSRCLFLGFQTEALDSPEDSTPYVAIIAAGTSDLSVSAEAANTLAYLGHPFVTITDVGVAGIHRLVPHLPTLQRATATIAIAGMEGALPSVLGGIINNPIIAVPTSVGYGSAQKGLTALHAMLTSCSSGITVVNIDNGFGAALACHTILTQVIRFGKINQ